MKPCPECNSQFGKVEGKCPTCGFNYNKVLLSELFTAAPPPGMYTNGLTPKRPADQ